MNQSTVEIRQAVLEDIDYLTDIAMDFYTASPYSKLGMADKDKIKDIIKYYIERQTDNTSIVLVADQQGIPEGMLIGFLQEALFSRDKMASELMWWLNPSLRETKIGAAMADIYQGWAIDTGCKYVGMCTIIELDLEGKLTSYMLKRGFIPAEQSFVRTV